VDPVLCFQRRCLLPATRSQGKHKAFDAVVRRAKAVGIDQVLVNGHGVAAQEQLGLNEVAVDFAQAGGSGNESRWQGWGNLSGYQGT